MSHVEIKLNGPSGSVHVDGHDLSNTVHTLNLDAEAGHPVSLTLKLNVLDTTTVDADRVTVWMDYATMALLERAGWTPPQDRDPMLLDQAEETPA